MGTERDIIDFLTVIDCGLALFTMHLWLMSFNCRKSHNHIMTVFIIYCFFCPAFVFTSFYCAISNFNPNMLLLQKVLQVLLIATDALLLTFVSNELDKKTGGQ